MRLAVEFNNEITSEVSILVEETTVKLSMGDNKAAIEQPGFNIAVMRSKTESSILTLTAVEANNLHQLLGMVLSGGERS
jgi:hypothetical protein